MATQLLIGSAIVVTAMYAMSRNKVVEGMYYEGLIDDQTNQMPVSKFPFVPIENILMNPGSVQYAYRVVDGNGPNTYIERNGGIARGGYKQEELAYRNAEYRAMY